MKSKIILFLVAILFAIQFTGCSYFTVYYQTGSNIQMETNPENIQICIGDIDREYQILGSVAVDVPGNEEKAALFLKKKAAKIGADAIIYVVPTVMHSYISRTGLSGVAVRFK